MLKLIKSREMRVQREKSVINNIKKRVYICVYIYKCKDKYKYINMYINKNK